MDGWPSLEEMVIYVEYRLVVVLVKSNDWSLHDITCL